MIRVENVSKSFGSKKALHQISFEIKEGEIFGFLGPSGSGKTTMINVLTGQLAADQGKTVLLGKNSQDLTSNDLEQIGIVSDGSGFYEKMSLYKNLLIYAKLYGLKSDRVNQVLQQVGLADAKDIIAEKLSTGMKQRMFLARALLNAPKILFLDEPTSGLDPTTSKMIHTLLQELKQAGTTIFLTTHDMNEATLLCDRLSLLNKGNLIEYGSPQDIIQKYHVDKKVHVVYNDGREQIVPFEELPHLDTTDLMTVHSCEPTLEEIFIRLTGEKLDV
ncbi:ATP-binding cassette domain-containing protein [Streptococcus mitis]|uniref:ATP-binding cassette domain-containing protein n=1 Tax=Streptococcus mitis TaxID=28037 RepID=A0A6L5H740_STRMT|nr:ABC transporter ATP-binding protein [Streptococcus mitis]MQP60693.1 ATP-binding cassette domain-containing protein [Streptococcus mitis]MQP70093.1 ATP-binding cassette domain-containing protein [Streptococcus mitis]MQP72346.1 ATP-binding cassette domain-containing protein [Streptococcus mitis]MQP74050.1 ATP-binding cassette domain-containing protein [Streptococcus mitis]MQP87233.1 ATP-binding cassette domain-containing protein [Streptococcus mitis]